VKWLGASPNVLLETTETKPADIVAVPMTSREMSTTTTTTATLTPITNTAAPAIYETTTMPEQLNHVEDARHVIAPSMPIPNQVELEAATTTTSTDPNKAIVMAEQQDNKDLAVGKEEEKKRVEKQDETSK
jgi:hypothetical protein